MFSIELNIGKITSLAAKFQDALEKGKLEEAIQELHAFGDCLFNVLKREPNFEGQLTNPANVEEASGVLGRGLSNGSADHVKNFREKQLSENLLRNIAMVTDAVKKYPQDQAEKKDTVNRLMLGLHCFEEIVGKGRFRNGSLDNLAKSSSGRIEKAITEEVGIQSQINELEKECERDQETAKGIISESLQELPQRIRDQCWRGDKLDMERLMGRANISLGDSFFGEENTLKTRPGLHAAIDEYVKLNELQRIISNQSLSPREKIAEYKSQLSKEVKLSSSKGSVIGSEVKELDELCKKSQEILKEEIRQLLATLPQRIRDHYNKDNILNMDKLVKRIDSDIGRSLDDPKILPAGGWQVNTEVTCPGIHIAIKQYDQLTKLREDLNKKGILPSQKIAKYKDKIENSVFKATFEASATGQSIWRKLVNFLYALSVSGKGAFFHGRNKKQLLQQVQSGHSGKKEKTKSLRGK
jgi:hypothetical protein